MRISPQKGMAVLAILAILVLGLFILGITRTHKTPPSSTTTVERTYTSPIVTSTTDTTEASAAAGHAIDVGTFAVKLPKNSSGATRSDSGATHEIAFSKGTLAGSVSSNPATPGQPLSAFASLYGVPNEHKASNVAGGKGYIFVTVSGGRFSIIIIGRTGGQNLTVHLTGPSSQLARGKAQAKKIAASLRASK